MKMSTAGHRSAPPKRAVHWSTSCAPGCLAGPRVNILPLQKELAKAGAHPGVRATKTDAATRAPLSALTEAAARTPRSACALGEHLSCSNAASARHPARPASHPRRQRKRCRVVYQPPAREPAATVHHYPRWRLLNLITPPTLLVAGPGHAAQAPANKCPTHFPGRLRRTKRVCVCRKNYQAICGTSLRLRYDVATQSPRKRRAYSDRRGG